ncbi:MAG: DUF4412 domain-containing protein [Gemmatimonadaceae bacterium]
MQILTNRARVLRVTMLLGATLSGMAIRGADAQGLTYDMKMTMQKGTGAVTSDAPQIMMSGHGKFQDGNSRMDMDESIMPGGFMGKGTYMILKNASRNEWIVDPAKQQYFEINVDSAANFSMASMNLLGGLVKMETSDVTADMQPMGPGEVIQGYSTMKYRITTNFVSKTSVLWRKSKSRNTTITDVWVAPQLAALYNPAVAASQGGGSSELAQKVGAAYAKIGKGAYLRTVSQMQSTGDRASAMTMTMDLLNIQRTRVLPSAFEVPKTYTKIDGTAALSLLGGGGGNGAGPNGNIIGQIGDSAKQGAKQGATQEVKNQASDKAKGVIRGIFGRRP